MPDYRLIHNVIVRKGKDKRLEISNIVLENNKLHYALYFSGAKKPFGFYSKLTWPEDHDELLAEKILHTLNTIAPSIGTAKVLNVEGSERAYFFGPNEKAEDIQLFLYGEFFDFPDIEIRVFASMMFPNGSLHSSLISKVKYNE